MAAPKKKFTKDQILKSLIKNNGLIYLVMEDLETSESSIHRYITSYKLGEIVADLKKNRHKTMVELAENGLHDALMKKKQWSIVFVLERLAKEEYSIKQIIDQTITENKVIRPKPPKKDK